MAKLKQTPNVEATVETTVQLKMSVQARQELSKLLFDRKQIVDWEKTAIGTKEKPGRRRNIDNEIQDLFKREKQGRALIEGCNFDGTGLIMVVGSSKKFDQIGFMKKHGLTQADFDEFTEVTVNDPYLKVTSPKGVK